MKRLCFCVAFIWLLFFATPPQASYMVISGAGAGDACGSLTEIGYSSVAGTDADVQSAAPQANLYTATCSGDLVTAYLYHRFSQTDNVKLCIYLDDGDSTPDSGDTLVACSNTVTGSSSSTWYNNTFSSGSLVKDSSYWLVVAPDTTNWSIVMQADAPNYGGTASYYGEPANMGTGTWGRNDYQFSMYATYQ
jgi:hypothetical protein